MRVYVAMPYGKVNNLSAFDLMTNVQKAIEVGRNLIKQGHNPYVPHLLHFIDLNWEDTPPESQWLEMAKAWMRQCEVVLRLGGYSSGADSEVKLAEELGIPVYYKLEDLIENEK